MNVATSETGDQIVSVKDEPQRDLPSDISEAAAAIAAKQDIRKVMQDLAPLYLSELPAMAQLIRQELAASQELQQASLAESASDRAHQVRGTAGCLGFVEISQIAGQLENYLRNAGSFNGPDSLPDYIAAGNLLAKLDRAILTEQSRRVTKIKDGAQPPAVLVPGL